MPAGTKVPRDHVGAPPLLPCNTLGTLYAGGPGVDGLQFKPVFVRHLAYLLDDLDHAGPCAGQQAEAAVRSAGGRGRRIGGSPSMKTDSSVSRAACAEPGPTSAGTAWLVGQRSLAKHPCVATPG